MNKTMYVIYDDETSAKSDVFTDFFDSKDKAVKEAEYFWNQKTSKEQARCDEFFVGLFTIDEDGCTDECLEVIKRFK